MGASVIAGAILCLTGAIVWAALHVVESFGAYEARRGKADLLILAVHEAQQAILKQNDTLIAEWRAARANGKKEVA